MKRLLSFLLCLVLLTGCGGGVEKKTIDSHMVTDCAGREVSVPEELDSVACLYAYAGHACVLLGQEGKLTSIVKGLKRDHLMEEKIEDIEALPVPYNDRAINIEELLASDPDLVLLRGEALVNKGEQQKLEKTGIPYLVIDYENMEEQKKSIQVLGHAYACEAEADAYLAYYEDMLKLVADHTAGIPEEDKLRVYHSLNEVVRTDQAGSVSDEILAAANLVNVIYDGGDLEHADSKVYTSVEQIYLWNPDWILCNEPEAVAYFQEDEKMQGLEAVREGQLLQLPVGISRWCHPGSIETPIAVLYLGKTLYPDYFEDIDLDEAVKDFYHRFLRIELSDSDLAEIYSGQGMRDPKND